MKNGMYGNILKKIVSVILIITLTVSMPIVQNTKVITVKAETISRRVEWNIKCLNAEKSYEESKNLKKIKVAILDSGLDYDIDLPAVEKKDFLEQEELHPLYQDMTGHGTSVASLICARENEDRITGIAANVELYIGRIFGYGNDAPVERVVKAINWAVEEKVNIIHMSFGTRKYSEELENAIERAYKKGILIIAAAGNAGQAQEDESTIEYPAAFDHVISVGATNKYNNMADFSSTGTELDVVAPGDQVLTDGAFGGVAVDNGTSISAAQVTGVAAVLWGKHPEKSNEFIKSLLVGSANKEAINSEECGEGLVDYKEADKNYKEMNEAYEEYKEEGASEKKAVEKAEEEEIPENTGSVDTHGQINYVNATWSKSSHKAVVENGNQAGGVTYVDTANINYVKMGAIQSDSYEATKGMSNNPYFHGRGDYFANTQYLYVMAKKYIEGNAGLPSLKELGLPNIKKKIKVKQKKGKNKKKANKKQKNKVKYKYIKYNQVKSINKKMKNANFLSGYFKSFQNKGDDGMAEYSDDLRKSIETDVNAQGYVLLGAAIHNLTDVFSHNIRKKTAKKYGGVWCPVVHKKKKTALKWLKVTENEKNSNVGASEITYLKYLVKNFAIADKRESKENPINLEIMYQLAYKAGICVLASINSEETWYNMLKNELECADTKGLKIKDINAQWRYLTGKNGHFSNLCEGKNNTEKTKIINYSIINYKNKRWIEVKAKNAYGNTMKVNKKLIYDKDFKGNIVQPSVLKGKKVFIKSYNGFKSKVTKYPVKFTIKYSCKGMKNVKLKKGKSNRTQVAKIGKDVTFLSRGEIFEVTKGKKKFKGWFIKKYGKEKKESFDANKKCKYPKNRGNSITLYPIFE